MNDKNPAQGNPRSDAESTPSHTIANEHEIDRANANADHESPEPELNRFQRILRRMRISWRRTRFHDRLIAGATLVIAIVGILQLIVYFQMKRIMESSGQQTDKLICAANIQASAAEKIRRGR